jgi:hypothetical protein
MFSGFAARQSGRKIGRREKAPTHLDPIERRTGWLGIDRLPAKRHYR